MTTRTIAGGRAKIERTSSCATFTLCRPRVLNALDLESIEALDTFISLMEKSPELSCAIIAGAGDKSFIAGGDLKAFAKLKGEEAGHTLSARVGGLLARLEGLPQVVIAAIDGDAYGGGVEVALACDLRIMGTSSRLKLTQARFGLTSGWGGGMRLTRLLGYSRALDCFLRMKDIPSSEALQNGLANEVVQDGAALNRAIEIAQQIHSIGPQTAAGIKRVMRFAADHDPSDAVDEERSVFATLWGSREHEERVERFLARKRNTTG